MRCFFSRYHMVVNGCPMSAEHFRHSPYGPCRLPFYSRRSRTTRYQVVVSVWRTNWLPASGIADDQAGVNKRCMVVHGLCRIVVLCLLLIRDCAIPHYLFR
jgi:hypothetical protein